MENEKLNRPTESSSEQKKNSTPGGNRNRNHRRHHHKNHKRNAEGGKPVQQDNVQEHAVAQEKTAAPAEAKNDQGGNNHSKNPKSQNRNRRDRQGNGQRNNHGNHHGVEKRPYSPYEEPAPEELSLEELRARIVVKSAQDTAPAEPLSEAKTSDAEDTLTVTEETMASLPPIDKTPSAAPASEDEEKVEIVGIRFRSAGKTYFFDPHGIRATKDQFAIVETARGPEFGEVCIGNTWVRKQETVAPLRPLIRIATPADIAHNEENRIKEKEALSVCQQKVLDHKLDMKLVDVQYAFDNSKLLFYFTADGRVDFRDLVKDLASVFRTRIELRQIGIRDEAKMLGGLGACGRSLCCSTFLPDFAQVSIKMAKEQNLSLNSTKISGLCGRLMCCLRFESDVYSEEIKKTPSVDAMVKTEDGIGFVISTNPLAGTIRVVLKDAPDMAPKQYHRDEVTVLEKDRNRSTDKKTAPEAE